MAKPNYSFAKSQRELEKKAKKEENKKNKAEPKGDADEGAGPDTDNSIDSSEAQQIVTGI